MNIVYKNMFKKYKNMKTSGTYIRVYILNNNYRNTVVINFSLSFKNHTGYLTTYIYSQEAFKNGQGLT